VDSATPFKQLGPGHQGLNIWNLMLSGGYRNFNFLQHQRGQQRFQGVALDKGGCRISAASD